ncbi:MAG TPA: HRDC domain-containing protein, partial [Pseudolysinimonas sp.]
MTDTEEHAVLDVIETVDDYRAAVAAIAAGTGPIAVDAERASGFRYSQRAYLIQVFRRDSGVFLFDPPAIGGDFSELAAVMAGEEWILHAASQDLACLREVGLDPERIFDTELGARLAGLPRVGLGAVVEELLGIHLAKEHSAADWSTRPLPQSWLVYAALDVELLPELRDKVGELLDAAGKTDIARQEFDAVLERETAVRVDPWRRLSGIHGLRQIRNLAVARELWTARDDYAREIDTAPGRLMPDGSIIAAARALPPTKRDLAAIKEFTGRASRSQLDRWFEAIQRGMATDDLPELRPHTDTLPPPRVWVEKNPEADGRFKRARADVTAT